jgi:hypothetical protein
VEPQIVAKIRQQHFDLTGTIKSTPEYRDHVLTIEQRHSIDISTFGPYFFETHGWGYPYAPLELIGMMADSVPALASVLTVKVPMSELQDEAASQVPADSTEGVQPRTPAVDGLAKDVEKDTISSSMEGAKLAS